MWLLGTFQNEFHSFFYIFFWLLLLTNPSSTKTICNLSIPSEICVSRLMMHANTHRREKFSKLPNNRNRDKMQLIQNLRQHPEKKRTNNKNLKVFCRNASKKSPKDIYICIMAESCSCSCFCPWQSKIDVFKNEW